MKPEAHNVVGSIEGIPEPAGWAEEGHTSRVDVCVEIHEGERMAYVAGLSEAGVSVRVDLDEAGWERLRHLATEVWMRMKTARLMDERETM
jgi:hypothetical protein